MVVRSCYTVLILLHQLLHQQSYNGKRKNKHLRLQSGFDTLGCNGEEVHDFEFYFVFKYERNLNQTSWKEKKKL